MSINDKITKLNELTQWFYTDEFNLDEAKQKYEEAANLAKEIEADLGALKNHIEVISKDFSKP
ncbi:exodeoxyribonuclease VII small subunit [Candidatus Saccharibacteria bacterium]|nr:exodeoxyribonuclease VII small subunit [Candidatus Saccharibacteria bacterium]